MAGPQDNGTRAVVQDPLAQAPVARKPDNLLQTGKVAPADIPKLAQFDHDDSLGKAIGGVEGILQQEFEKNKDTWITEGKVAYQTGVTEQQMLATGNAFTAQGYRTLQARDQINNWFTDQTVAMDQTGKQMDPKDYQVSLQSQRADILKGITDPYAQKVASAAFEDMSPRLAQAQALKNSEYNRGQRVTAFSTMLSSTANTSATAGSQGPDDVLRVSPVAVAPVMQPSAKDRDIGIRTILGEAANEGADGMAAVAHVLRNRATDVRWPSSIAAVAMQPKQFSAWNDGPGGNDLVNQYGPGDPIYDRAGKVFDTVMSGMHVDPTGGATHYYSPAGMQALVDEGSQKNVVPAWLNSEEARSGGQIKIGGHIFVGKSGPVDVRPSVQAIGQGDTPAPQVTSTTIAAGTQGDINAVPAKEGVGQTGVAQAAGQNEVLQAIHGYKGLNNEDKATAVSDAMRRGLDVGDVSLFHDGGGVATLQQLGAKPGEIDEVIKAKKRYDDKQQTDFNIDREKYRSDILARADKGEDVNTLLTDIDGKVKSGFINDQNARSLAATASDKVVAANKVAEEKAKTDYSPERMQYRNDILARADKGEALTGILTDINEKVKSGFLTDAAGSSLASSAADKIRSETTGNSKLSNPDMLNELGGLYQQVATGGDFKTLAVQGKAIADKYGASERDVQSIMTHMFNTGQEYQNKLRADVATRAKTKLEQDGIKSTVNRALSQGYGLDTTTGSITTTNDAGQPQTITAQEYGIQQIKDKWSKQYADAVSSGQMTAAQAKPELERKVLLELQNHNVVDKQIQSQFVGSLAGNIVGKDGQLKPAATQAYDTWLTLKTTPGISQAYLSKVVGDDGTRSLLETAYKLDAGDLSKDQALLKAHEILNDPNRDPSDVLKKDAVWKQKMDVDMPKALIERTDPGFFNRLFGTQDRSERERILNNNQSASNYVNNRAEAYHFQNPNEDGEVSLTKAIQDLQAHSVPVMGNLIITKPGKELDKVMGISDFGPTAAQDAVSNYINKNGTALWGKAYSDRNPGTMSRIGTAVSEADINLSPQGIAADLAPGTFDNAGRYAGSHPKSPPVSITYNQELGVMTVDLYKDASMKQTLGQPKHLSVKSIGDEYSKEQTTPGTWATAWNSMFKGTAKAVKDVQDWSYTTPISKPIVRNSN